MKDLDELQEYYLETVKKSVIDYVLREPADMAEGRPLVATGSRETEDRLPVPKDRSNSFRTAARKLHANLHAINPLMAQLLDLWHRKYR